MGISRRRASIQRNSKPDSPERQARLAQFELADFIKEFEQWTTELKVHTAGKGPIEQATSVMVTAADNTCSVELILKRLAVATSH